MHPMLPEARILPENGAAGIGRGWGARSGVQTKTLELWDFGVPVDSLDWTRFPSIPSNQ